jgi:outer membrane PBP1 activator LpoA protein
MAVITRRPRLTFFTIVTVSLIAAACSLVRPVETPVDKQGDAVKLAAAGKHAESAQAYAELATDLPSERDNYELLAAEQWVAAGNIAAAAQAYAAVSPNARTTLPTSRALVAAEIAVAQKDGARAVRELDTIPVPTEPDLAQNYWYLRGEGEFLAGHPVEGTRAFVAREPYLNAAAQSASRAELFNKLRSAADHGQSLKPPPKSDPIVAGWLALGPVAVEVERNPMRATAAVQ